MIHEADVLLTYYFKKYSISIQCMPNIDCMFFRSNSKDVTKFCHLRKTTLNFSSYFIIDSGSIIICIHYMSSREKETENICVPSFQINKH